MVPGTGLKDIINIFPVKVGGVDTIRVTIKTTGVPKATFNFPAAGITSIGVFALAGNDTVTVKSSAKLLVPTTIFGGADNDKLNGGRGNDIIRGGTGNDTIRGGLGNDLLLGEEGNDSLDGGVGSSVDVLRGGPGRDVCFVDSSDRTSGCETVVVGS